MVVSPRVFGAGYKTSWHLGGVLVGRFEVFKVLWHSVLEKKDLLVAPRVLGVQRRRVCKYKAP